MTDSPKTFSTSRTVVLVVLVAALVVLASSDAVHSLLVRLLAASDVIIAQHAVLGALVFVGLAALSALLAFFSSAMMVAPAVHAWGTTITALLLWLGWMLGGLASYTVARRLGRPVVRKLASAPMLAQLESRLTSTTPFGLVLLFQLAFPSEIPGYLLGLVAYPLRRYLAALALAELPYAIGTVLLGEGFVERRIGLLVGLGAAAVAATVVIARLARKRLR